MSKNNRNKVPQFSVRLTADQYQWFDSFCESEGLPRNQVIKQSLELFKKSIQIDSKGANS